MPSDTIFGLSVLGYNNVFIDKVGSWLLVINNIPRGRDLLGEIRQSRNGFRIREKFRNDECLAYATADSDGVYKLEKYVLEKNWAQAVTEVRHAVQNCNSPAVIEKLRTDLTTGIASVTYSDTISRKKQSLTGLDPHHIKRIRKHGTAIDTSKGVGQNSSLYTMLNPSSTVNYTACAQVPLHGWYILIRKLKPYLRPGDGIARGEIEVHEGADAKKFKPGTNPAVALAHELIHGLHFMKGVGYLNAAMEESQTVGLYPYNNERYTENYFRIQLKDTGFQGQISKGQRNHY